MALLEIMILIYNGKNLATMGLKKQGVGELLICGVQGGRGGSRKMGLWVKTSVPNFLENIDRRSCNDGGRELISAFHNPHRKCRPLPWAVARTLDYLEGVPS